MPVVIQEIVISVSVEQQAARPAPRRGDADEALIRACVERVLEVLRQKDER